MEVSNHHSVDAAGELDRAASRQFNNEVESCFTGAAVRLLPRRAPGHGSILDKAWSPEVRGAANAAAALKRPRPHFYDYAQQEGALSVTTS
jgi:hypothetical protein